jgi:beta-lactamase class A
MSTKIIVLYFVLGFLLFSCKEKVKITGNPIEIALKSENTAIKRVIDSLDKYEVQIKYTQINRTKDGIIFTEYDFQNNPNQYFYPASSVKFLVAVLTLEKLNSMKGFTMHTKFYIEGDTLETTVANEVSKLFAVSDNDAYNRLFEFLGQGEINQQVQSKGIKNVRISHRVSTPNSDDITTNAIVFYKNDSTTQIREKIVSKPIKPLQLDRLQKGKAYFEDNILIEEPFDFSLKNYYAINAQHEVLKRVIFPQNFAKEQQFNLTQEQRDYLLKAMHTLPAAIGYDKKEYYDSYVKFFMFGDTKEPMPKNIEIYNKVGYAYGTLTDCAYIKDTENNVDFFLTATILVNNNQIFNDNVYDYDTVGIPFLAALGQEIYRQELLQKKQN